MPEGRDPSRRVLVTGATGFIGAALCRRMLEARWAVRAVQRRPMTVAGAPAVDWRTVADIDGGTEWAPLLDGVDVVVHLAARVHVLEETATHPLREFRRVNVEGTRALAEAAVAAGVDRFVFMSSLGVNGETSGAAPLTEASPPMPATPYAISKWEAEQKLAEVAASSPLDTVILRPPLVYGPQAKGNFPRLVRFVRNGIPLPLGAVRNQRSLLGIDNLCDAVLAAITSPGAAGRTLLIADGQDLSTPEIIRAVAAGLERPARLLAVPVPLLRIGARLGGRGKLVRQLVDSFQVDASRARDVLDWSPRFGVREGLKAAARGSSPG